MIEHIGAPAARAGTPGLPYTPAVKAGDFVFVSGQLGIDADAKPVSVDVGGQARVCIQKLRQLLQAAGGDLNRIVKINVWLTDLADFPAFNAVYRELMPAAPPARSTVISGLVIPGTLIEIDCIAYLGK
jgi:2-iminobutanoate/2-iminopropanoate deaminase